MWFFGHPRSVHRFGSVFHAEGWVFHGSAGGCPGRVHGSSTGFSIERAFSRSLASYAQGVSVRRGVGPISRASYAQGVSIRGGFRALSGLGLRLVVKGCAYDAARTPARPGTGHCRAHRARCAHMNCPNCSAAVQPGQRFCPSCGTRLDRGRANCGAALPDAARFCPECGTPTAEAPGAAPQEAAAPAVERRLVSVLFVDLVGFTELAARLDPEEIRELQAGYFARCARDRRALRRHGREVHRRRGHGGLGRADRERGRRRTSRPRRPRPDRRDARPHGPTARRHRPREPASRPAKQRSPIGADGQGMVSGDTVNLAARLQSAAPTRRTILDDEATHRAADAAVVFDPAGERELKGFPGRVATWRARPRRRGRGGSGRTDELEAPFVGRSAELRLLKDLFHATARERRLRVVSITGQAGIGKSRLAWEFEKYIDGISGDVYWHQGRSPAYGEGITFWALGEMVRRRAGIARGRRRRDGAAEGPGDARHVGPGRGRAQPNLDSAIDVLLGLEGRAPAERGELFGAWRTLFERIADHGPVVLVFEDLQWADAGLLDFIGHLLEWSRQQPIFVVTLARPELVERFPTWGAGQRNFTSLHLEPLADEDMRALLAGLVPGLPRATVRAILGAPRACRSTRSRPCGCSSPRASSSGEGERLPGRGLARRRSQCRPACTRWSRRGSTRSRRPIGRSSSRRPSWARPSRSRALRRSPPRRATSSGRCSSG